MGELHREAPYEGRPGQTHAELVHYSCTCGSLFPLNVLRAVNVATDRELAEAAVADNLNRAQCPYCSAQIKVDLPYVLHHPHEERFVLVIPESRRHEELELRAELLMELSKSTEALIPPYVTDFQVVFGTEGLRDSLSRPPAHVMLREELANKQHELEERERKVAEVERMQQLREAQLNEKELAVEKQEESVMMREERLKERGENVTRQEDDLRQREAGQRARLEALEVRTQMVEQREAEVAKREHQLAVRTSTLQEWEARLQAAEGVATARGSDLVSPAPAPMVQAPATDPAAAPAQDIVTSLMRDPELDEMPSEPTQRSRSMTAALGERLDDDEAEELTDDDLIEEAEELSADDLIEGETDLHALPQSDAGVTATPASAGVEHTGLGIHDGDASSLPVLPGAASSPPVAPPPAGMANRPPLSSAPSAPPQTGEVEAPPEPEPQPEPQPEPKPTSPFLEPPAQWVRTGDPTTHHVVGDDVYLLARVDEETAEKIKGDGADLLVQLHLMETYPLITLTLLLDKDAEEPGGLHWFIDIEEDLDRRLLQLLRRHFRASVLLYDMSYTLVDEVRFEAPREVNVARVVDRATQELGVIGHGKLSPVAAKKAFRDGWDWVGKKKHPYTEDAYAEIGSVGEAKLALGILAYWSETQNLDYLVLTKSVPVDLLDTITRRILDGALKFGLWLPQALKERAVALALAPDVPALTIRQIEAFAALGESPEGLEPTEAADNWQRLLRDADELDLPVDKRTVELAESIIEKVSASDERDEQDAAPLSREEIEKLDDDAVLALLERRSSRKLAALVLAERRNPDHLDALFRAARKMGRPDLVQVVPALLAYGESAGDFFIEGLTARKSFTRQACAVALGELKLRRAVVPLLHQLMAEKTPVWQEIARALGRYGPAGIKPLHRYLRDPKGKEERLVRAMASFAIHGAAKQVEKIASGGPPGGELGQKALEDRDLVRAIEEQVQGSGEIEESATLLRFSRRLYQAIAGEAQGEDDELLEELGDSDIMELEDGE